MLLFVYVCCSEPTVPAGVGSGQDSKGAGDKAHGATQPEPKTAGKQAAHALELFWAKQRAPTRMFSMPRTM